MALAISSGFATDRGSAARETVTLVLLFALLIVATDTLSRRPGSVATVARVLGWVAAAVGGFAVLESVGVLPGEFAVAGTPYFRATGGFAWPNELAMYLAISLPFTVMLMREASGSLARVIAMLALGLAIAGLVSTFSRGSWLATVVAPGVLLFVSERGFALRVWFAAAAALLVLDLAAGGVVTARIAGTLTDPLVGQRFALTQAGVLMFLAHPLVGVGPGGFEAGLDQFGLLVPGLWDFVGSAHNAYVHIAAETGILGLLALVGLLLSTLWTALPDGEGLDERLWGRAGAAVARDGLLVLRRGVRDRICRVDLRTRYRSTHHARCGSGLCARPGARHVKLGINGRFLCARPTGVQRFALRGDDPAMRTGRRYASGALEPPREGRCGRARGTRPSGWRSLGAARATRSGEASWRRCAATSSERVSTLRRATRAGPSRPDPTHAPRGLPRLLRSLGSMGPCRTGSLRRVAVDGFRACTLGDRARDGDSPPTE